MRNTITNATKPISVDGAKRQARLLRIAEGMNAFEADIAKETRALDNTAQDRSPLEDTVFSESREYYKAHTEYGDTTYTTTSVLGNFENGGHNIELKRGVYGRDSSTISIRKQGLETTYQVVANASLNSWCSPLQDYGFPDDLRGFTLTKNEAGGTPVYSLTEGSAEAPKRKKSILSWLFG